MTLLLIRLRTPGQGECGATADDDEGHDRQQDRGAIAAAGQQFPRKQGSKNRAEPTQCHRCPDARAAYRRPIVKRSECEQDSCAPMMNIPAREHERAATAKSLPTVATAARAAVMAA